MPASSGVSDASSPGIATARRRREAAQGARGNPPAPWSTACRRSASSGRRIGLAPARRPERQHPPAASLWPPSSHSSRPRRQPVAAGRASGAAAAPAMRRGQTRARWRHRQIRDRQMSRQAATQRRHCRSGAARQRRARQVDRARRIEAEAVARRRRRQVLAAVDRAARRGSRRARAITAGDFVGLRRRSRPGRRGLRMPAFSPAIAVQRVAEELHVVEGDRRDRVSRRALDHVGRVEPPAQARLPAGRRRPARARRRGRRPRS